LPFLIAAALADAECNTSIGVFQRLGYSESLVFKTSSLSVDVSERSIGYVRSQFTRTDAVVLRYRKSRLNMATVVMIIGLAESDSRRCAAASICTNAVTKTVSVHILRLHAGRQHIIDHDHAAVVNDSRVEKTAVLLWGKVKRPATFLPEAIVRTPPSV
jgi:hypothetical protein